MKPVPSLPAGRPIGFYPAVGKRLLDVSLAGGAIVLFLPFWILLALLVRGRSVEQACDALGFAMAEVSSL